MLRSCMFLATIGLLDKCVYSPVHKYSLSFTSTKSAAIKSITLDVPVAEFNREQVIVSRLGNNKDW